MGRAIIAGAILTVFICSIAVRARAAGAVCRSNSADEVQKTGADGSQCSAVASTGDRRYAKAAARGASSSATAEGTNTVATAIGGKLGASHSLAEGGAFDTAKLVKAVAINGATSTANGVDGAAATAIGKGAGVALAGATLDCTAIATETRNAQAGAVCKCGGECRKALAQASATASGRASAFSNSDCVAIAHGVGVDSAALATCNNPNSVVKVSATRGGMATGSDTAPPQCNPGSGTARVRSPAGNCG